MMNPASHGKGLMVSAVTSLLLCSVAYAQRGATITAIDGGPARVGERFLRAGDLLPDGEEVAVAAGARMMAYFPAGETQVAVIAVGPTRLAAIGTEIELLDGTLILSSDQPAARQQVELYIGSETTDVLAGVVAQGDTYVLWDGQTLDLAYVAPPAAADQEAALAVVETERRLGSGQWLSVKPGGAVSTGASETLLEKRGLDATELAFGLSFAAAKAARIERQQDLFAKVMDWDRAAQAVTVAPVFRRQVVAMARLEIRQVNVLASLPQLGLSGFEAASGVGTVPPPSAAGGIGGTQLLPPEVAEQVGGAGALGR